MSSNIQSQYDLNNIFSQGDFSHFKEWIDLDLDCLTWQGRHMEDFEEFWGIFFVDGLSISQITERFDYAILESSIGPLSSWFTWLKGRFLCYVFINHDLSVLNIASSSNISLGVVAGTIRGFLCEKYPNLDRELSERLQISNMASDNLEVTYKLLMKELNISRDINGRIESEVMPALEITLYDEWSIFLGKLRKNFYHPQFNFAQLKKSMSFKRQLRFIGDLILLLMIGFSLIYGIQYANKRHEQDLTQKISIYESQFKWLDRTLSFKSEDLSEDYGNALDYVDDIESIEQEDVDIVAEDDVEERFDVESETVLTSWDALPKDFDVVSYEQSKYEEFRKKGYRESRYGHTKVYRVLIRSEDLDESRQRLNNLVGKYNVTQVDNVRPGMRVLGGIYYNLYVPKVYLKEFMAQVTGDRDAVMYESRTRTRRSPAGQSKVFIWIKSV